MFVQGLEPPTFRCVSPCTSSIRRTQRNAIGNSNLFNEQPTSWPLMNRASKRFNSVTGCSWETSTFCFISGTHSHDCLFHYSNHLSRQLTLPRLFCNIYQRYIENVRIFISYSLNFFFQKPVEFHWLFNVLKNPHFRQTTIEEIGHGNV